MTGQGSLRRAPPYSVRSRRSAFSLIEMLVAMAILGVAIVMLSQNTFLGVQQSQLTQRRAQGLLLAQSRMEEFLAHRADLSGWVAEVNKMYPIDPAAKDRGFNDQRFARYRWNYEITDAAADQKMADNLKGLTGLKEITVRCTWPKRGESGLAQCELKTLLLVPKGSLASLDNSRVEEGRAAQ